MSKVGCQDALIRRIGGCPFSEVAGPARLTRTCAHSPAAGACVVGVFLHRMTPRVLAMPSSTTMPRLMPIAAFGHCSKMLKLLGKSARRVTAMSLVVSASFCACTMASEKCEKGSTASIRRWCGMAWWRGVAWCGVAWRGVAWRGVAWHGVA